MTNDAAADEHVKMTTTRRRRWNDGQRRADGHMTTATLRWLPETKEPSDQRRRRIATQGRPAADDDTECPRTGTSHD
jgi:hypothetical protein